MENGSLLAARDAIGAVLVRYCVLLDRREFAAMATEVFTSDALYGHPRGGWRGGPEIARRLERVMQRFEGTAHFLSNLSIDVKGGEATSLSYVTAWHWLRETSTSGPGRPADWVMVGAYRDELVLAAQGWRIQRRRFEAVSPSISALGRQPELEL